MRLLDWINSHDCGITPTAVALPDGKIQIRVLCVNTEEGIEHCEWDVVSTLAEARDVLGY